MTSSDREILININGQIASINGQIEIINKRLDRLEQTQNNHSLILAKIQDQQLINTTRIEMLMWGTGLGFALMAVVVTLLSIFVPLIITRAAGKSESQPQNTQNFKLSDIIELLKISHTPKE